MNLLNDLKKGAILIKDRKLDEAEKLYIYLLARMPEFPDAYYGLYKVFLLKDKRKQAIGYFTKALDQLSISISYNDIHKKIFNDWKSEYKEVFRKDYGYRFVKNDKHDLYVEQLIKKEKFKEALIYINKVDLTKNLLLAKYTIYKTLDEDSKAINLSFKLLNIFTDNVSLWFDIGNLLQKNGYYYSSVKVFVGLVKKDESNYEYFYKLAHLAFDIDDFNIASEYLKKVLKLNKEEKKARLQLSMAFIQLGYLDDARKLLEDGKEYHDDFCTNIISLLSFMEINGCIDYLDNDDILDNGKFVYLAHLYEALLIYRGNEKAKLVLDKIDKILSFNTFDKDRVKDKTLKYKLDKLENTIAFFTIGRGGSFFFHSLIDGHKDVATIPGVYLKGYFGLDTWSKIVSSNKSEILNKFMRLYEPIFNASSSNPVPGDPMSGKVNIGEKSGLTTLGKNRDISLKLDKVKFINIMKKYLKSFSKINEKEFFKLIHLAFEELRDVNVNEKNAIFYHIHNPTLIEYMRFLKIFPNSKSLYIIRNWLQVLESWMHSSYPNFKLAKNLSYEIRLDNFKFVYQKMLNTINTRTIHQRSNMFLGKDSVYALKLEDLKDKPKEVMQAISKFMNIEYSDDLIESSFMGYEFHSNKSRLNKDISKFDKSSVNRKIGVLFSERDSLLLNTILKPWNEHFEYKNEFDCLSVKNAFNENKLTMDWELKLMNYFELNEQDILSVIKFRKEKFELLLNTQDEIKIQLQKVKLIKPEL